MQRRPRRAAGAASPVLEVVPPPVQEPSAETIARSAVDAAANKKAEDIVLLDLRELTSMADYFVICSASSDRQLKSVVEGIEQDLRIEGVRPVHVEGDHGSGWVLVDFGDVICHVFKQEERDYYRLEDLWTGAKTLVRMQ
ncbi:MAG TPA: ribosome silencing factor [Chloroflexota bacterium]|jgi:ribosome-associated protein|nr:ribosome silencing factor [Chloroflexota bacterium]